MIQYDKVTIWISYKFLNILLNFDPVGPGWTRGPPALSIFSSEICKKIILRKNDPVRQSYNLNFIQIFEYFIKFWPSWTRLDQRSPRTQHFFKWDLQKKLFYVKMIQYDKVTIFISYKFLNILLNLWPSWTRGPPALGIFSSEICKYYFM